jgi:transposase
MAKPYSEDLRVRIVAADRDGGTIAQIAEQFGVSVSSVTRFRRLWRETGEVSAGKFGGHKKHALAPHEDLVREVVAAQPDITLAELRAILACEKVTVALSSISRFLHHLNLTFKKKSFQAAERDRPDVAAQRQALAQQQHRLKPQRLVFIDETSVATTIARIYGWAKRGERLVYKLPHGTWKTVTFVAALRHDRVTAPLVLEGPMTGEIFKAYVEQHVAPTLQQDDIVFMDNVRLHKVAGIKDLIEARGAELRYLPAYSPDFNPIEEFFAKFKAGLRKIAACTIPNGAFTLKGLYKAVASCLDQITHAECTAFLANSGYGQPKRKTL